MNNQEKIRRAFDPLQPSPEFSVEGNMMNRKSVKKPVLVLCAALVLVLAGITAAYASDLGGFRETLTFWFGGKQHTAEVVQDEDGVVTWTDGEGNSHSMGGIAYDENGNPRPMTAEELIQAELSGLPVLNLFPDGTVFLEFYEHYVEVTDQVDSGRVEAKLDHDGVTYYITMIGSREKGWRPYTSTEGFAP